MSKALFEGPATRPEQWQHSAHLARATWVEPQQLCPPGTRLVVVAPPLPGLCDTPHRL